MTDKNSIGEPLTIERNAANKEWHCPTFMSTSTIAEKEAWLEQLLESANGSVGDMASRQTPNATVVDVQAFLVVLKALASKEAVSDAGAPRRADVWMNLLLNSNHLQPTAECYQYVIQAWANSSKEQVMVIRNRSERWLNDLLKKSGDKLLQTIMAQEQRPIPGTANSPIIQPTIGCFNAFLDGLTRGRQGKNRRDRQILLDSAKLAESILRSLHSISIHRRKQQENGLDCHDKNFVVVRPDTETFNYVIRGWTRCKHERNVHKQVLRILRLMEGYQRSNPAAFITDRDAPRPNTKSYTMTMDALITEAKLKAGRHQNYQNKLRKQERYTLQKQSIAEDPSFNGVNEMNEAAAILEYMHNLHDAGVEGVVPHRVPYNILITGWAALAHYNKHRYYRQASTTHGNRGEEFEAEGILRTMMTHRDNGFEDASPDAVSYEKVILAWANSGHPNAGKRAMWWLKQLWKDYELYHDSTSNESHTSSLKPTVNTYNIVMKALSRTDGALAAENVLLNLGEKYRDGTNHPELCPNSESFAIVIEAWLDSAKEAQNANDRIVSIRRAYEWLASLRTIENESNLSTAPQLFTGLLSACKECANRRPHVLALAQQIFDDFRQSRHTLNHNSYATLLQVGLRAHLGPDRCETRKEFVETIFEECCEDGLVSNIFVRTLVDDYSVECRDLVNRTLREWPHPASWSRNVRNSMNQCAPSDIQPYHQRNTRGNQ